MAAAIKPRPVRRVMPVTEEQLLRLLRFPAVRREISKALVRAVPERAEFRAGWRYYRFRLRDPKEFHPALYAVIPVGRRGTLLVIGTPYDQIRKPRELAAFLSRMGYVRGRWTRRLTQIQRRSLIYQLRSAGIIGGARVQAVLVPKERVQTAVTKFAGRPEVLRARAIPNEWPDKAGIVRRAYQRISSNPILATLGINPKGTEDIKVPFRHGQKISTETLLSWVNSLPAGPFRERYEKAIKQYRRFHLGALPKYWTFNVIPLGSQKRITDIDFVVSEGKEWMAPYQVPPHSRKYNPKTEGRFIHAHGESKIGLPSISRPAHPSKLPERFHTPDGRFIGVLPTKNIKITDWYRG